MLILIANVGSSSYKYQLLDMRTEALLAKGSVERIGNPPSLFTHQVPNNHDLTGEIDAPTHNDAVSHVLRLLTDQEIGVLDDLQSLSGVGFKTVYARGITRSALLDETTLRAMEANIPLAPLHNPAYLAAIHAFRELLPRTPMVGVFETWFHETIPDYAYELGVPRSWVEKYGVRRYGFHGASHRYISQRVPELLNRPAGELKLISAHLGGSSSLCAICCGQSVDTSMSYSTQAGVIQSTRCGDLDAFAVLYVMEQEGLSFDEVREMLIRDAGLKGIAGVSGDMRDLERAAAEGNDRARLAVDTFHNNVKKTIGAYVATLGGIDALVFTGGIGEHDTRSRAAICDGLEWMGIELDPEKNERTETVISTDTSRVTILVVPTNEEIIVARETVRVISEIE